MKKKTTDVGRNLLDRYWFFAYFSVCISDSCGVGFKTHRHTISIELRVLYPYFLTWLSPVSFDYKNISNGYEEQ